MDPSQVIANHQLAIGCVDALLLRLHLEVLVGVVLVGNVADDHLDQILDGDDPVGARIFVDHDGKMRAAGAHIGKHIERTARLDALKAAERSALAAVEAQQQAALEERIRHLDEAANLEDARLKERLRSAVEDSGKVNGRLEEVEHKLSWQGQALDLSVSRVSRLIKRAEGAASGA